MAGELRREGSHLRHGAGQRGEAEHGGIQRRRSQGWPTRGGREN
jgi:hypothetical protein